MFSEPAQPYTILDEMFFISSVTVYQQAGRPGTKSRFLLCVLPASGKNACWETSQTLLQIASTGCRLRVPMERFHTNLTTVRSTRAVVFFVPGLGHFHVQRPFYVGFDGQQLPHLLTGAAVLWVGLSLFGQEFVVL